MRFVAVDDAMRQQAVNASASAGAGGPGGVIVYARRWVCKTPHVVQRRTARLRLPDNLAYRPDPVTNPHTLTVSNARSATNNLHCQLHISQIMGINTLKVRL